MNNTSNGCRSNALPLSRTCTVALFSLLLPEKFSVRHGYKSCCLSLLSCQSRDRHTLPCPIRSCIFVFPLPEMFPSSASSFYPCHPYDGHHHLYTPYGDRYSGMDSAARRKNATRETTNTLKAWLYEHRKNPYPTKGEKIMLAIITKMTLTQVSMIFPTQLTQMTIHLHNFYLNILFALPNLSTIMLLYRFQHGLPMREDDWKKKIRWLGSQETKQVTVMTTMMIKIP